MPFTTGILLFDEAEELDFVGPLEVFGMARQEGDRVVTIAEKSDPVRANLGLRVVPDHTIADAPPLDVLVVIVASLVVATLAPLYPSLQAARLEPVTAIRYE